MPRNVVFVLILRIAVDRGFLLPVRQRKLIRSCVYRVDPLTLGCAVILVGRVVDQTPLCTGDLILAVKLLRQTVHG